MTSWRFVALNGAVVSPLPGARSRKITFRVDAAPDASFTLNGRSDDAATIIERATDVVAYRDGEKLYRGRVGPTADKIARGKHTTTVQTAGYRALLARRQLWAEQIFTAEDQAEILWSLIEYTQALDGGDLGIVQGTGSPTGVDRDRTYEAGKRIGEAAEQLGQVANGFEWEIDAELALNVFYPERGVDRSEEDALVYIEGMVSNVVALDRDDDPATFANAWRVTGDATLVTEERESAGIAAAPEGRWEDQAGYTDVVEQDTLDARADFLLADHEVPQPAYKLELRRGFWRGPDHLWIGDYVPTVIRSGRLDESSVRRILEMEISIDPNGSEQVSAVVGRAVENRSSRRIVDLLRRVETLERT